MAKTTKAQSAAEAAPDAAAAAAKDAKRLSKTLPKKDAKKLRSLADEAKEAYRVSKKKVAHSQRKVEKKAVAAIARVEKATDTAEGKRAAIAPRTQAHTAESAEITSARAHPHTDPLQTPALGPLHLIP